MNTILKITSSISDNRTEIFNKLKNYKNEIIDISELNIFDAAKTIIMISTYEICKTSNKKIKYKVGTKNIQNLLQDIPIYKKIELI